MAAFTVYGRSPCRWISARLPEDPYRLPSAKVLSEPQHRLAAPTNTVVNVMLGVPLGFALLGMIVADRRWPVQKQVVLGECLLPLCVLFASAVEFSQLFTPSRNCSAAGHSRANARFGRWNARLGVVGPVDHRPAHAVATRADFNAAGRILIAYIVLLAFIQTLPFDVGASPRNLYHKLKDHDTKEGTCYLVPFGEFDGVTDAGSGNRSAS